MEGSKRGGKGTEDDPEEGILRAAVESGLKRADEKKKVAETKKKY